jgi:4-carboxymuconolactone decarboxylase
MRVPVTLPVELTADQKPIYEDMRRGIEEKFRGFIAIRDDGALLGPWNPWIRWPQFGGPIWELTKAMSFSPTLPKPVREVAILVTGAKFHAAYEIYAHVLMGEQRGLPDETLSTIIAGQRPATLTRELGIAYDVASALVNGGSLPELTYKQAVAAFGESATAELIYLVGLYCLVSVTLNGFDVPIPENTAP